LNDLKLHEQRLLEARMKKVQQDANNLSIDKVVELGFESWRHDPFAQFVAGYNAELTRRIYDLPNFATSNLDNARGRVAARYDLERMGA
jgi:hypothetical protein